MMRTFVHHHAHVRATSSPGRVLSGPGHRTASGQTAKIRHILGRGAVQPKLTVSEPNDPLEQEADRVAEEVMRMEAPAPATRMHASPPAVQRACSGCGELQTQASPEWVQREAEEEEELVHLKRSAGQRGIAISISGLERPMLKSSCPCGGGCSSCRSGVVGHGDARLQHEADQVSDRVLREAAPARAPPLAAAASAGAAEVGDRSDARQRAEVDLPGLRTAHAGGELLSAELRAFYEPRFGRDFSQVRLHHGPGAGASACALGARAYTLGRDIAFAPGEFQPHSIAGRRLIAHELVHTMQQGAAGDRLPPSAGAVSLVQRQPEDTGVPVDTGSPELVDTGELGQGPDIGVEEPGEEIRLCGPDIEEALAAAAERTGQHFAGLGEEQRKEFCHALVAIGADATTAWDIHDLQFRGIGWIHDDYAPDAAVGGAPEGDEAQPRCEMSVTLNGRCHMPNTVNYYIYGVMCRLCEGFLQELPEPAKEDVPPEAVPQQARPALTGASAAEGAFHKETESPTAFIKARTKIPGIVVNKPLLGSDLFLLAMLGAVHHDFIWQVMNELWRISRDDVAYWFFVSASDDALVELARTTSGHNLILDMWSLMRGGVTRFGEADQEERLLKLIPEAPVAGTGSDTGGPKPGMEPEDDTRDDVTEDTGGEDQHCLFAGGPAAGFTRDDAKRFSLANVLCIVNFYKDFAYGGDRSAASADWARAGYNGDRGSSVPGAENRTECIPSTVEYDGRPFKLKWSPHLDEPF